MVDVMPVSIESVTFAGPMLGEKDMAILVENSAEHKAEVVPRLEKVFYERSKSLTKAGREYQAILKCERHRFHLEAGDKQGISRG